MGCDIADINNDGLTDVMTLDMLPKDEQVIKTTAERTTMRFTILNCATDITINLHGTRCSLTGELIHGELMFSDIAPFAGVEATDWSWSSAAGRFRQ
jgi:hypothetical protein